MIINNKILQWTHFQCKFNAFYTHIPVVVCADRQNAGDLGDFVANAETHCSPVTQTPQGFTDM